MTEPDGVWQVRQALAAAAGNRAEELLYARSKHLGNLSPYDVAKAPSGYRIVFAELDKIVLQSRMARV